MLDINLGNKTLFVGVLIALILSYGMINFDSAPTSSRTLSAISTSLQSSDTNEATVATAAAESHPTKDASQPRLSRRERQRLESM